MNRRQGLWLLVKCFCPVGKGKYGGNPGTSRFLRKSADALRGEGDQTDKFLRKILPFYGE